MPLKNCANSTPCVLKYFIFSCFLRSWWEESSQRWKWEICWGWHKVWILRRKKARKKNKVIYGKIKMLQQNIYLTNKWGKERKQQQKKNMRKNKKVTIDVIKGTIVNNKMTWMKQEGWKYFKMNFYILWHDRDILI